MTKQKSRVLCEGGYATKKRAARAAADWRAVKNAPYPIRARIKKQPGWTGGQWIVCRWYDKSRKARRY